MKSQQALTKLFVGHCHNFLYTRQNTDTFPRPAYSYVPFNQVLKSVVAIRILKRTFNTGLQSLILCTFLFLCFDGSTAVRHPHIHEKFIRRSQAYPIAALMPEAFEETSGDLLQRLQLRALFIRKAGATFNVPGDAIHIKIAIAPFTNPLGFRMHPYAGWKEISPSPSTLLHSLQLTILDLDTSYIDVIPIYTSYDFFRPAIKIKFNQKDYYIVLNLEYDIPQTQPKRLLASKELYSWVDEQFLRTAIMAINALVSRVPKSPDTVSNGLRSKMTEDSVLGLQSISSVPQAYLYLFWPKATQESAKTFNDSPPHYYPLYLAKSLLPQAGLGIFANQTIPKGERIALVSGKTRYLKTERCLQSAVHTHTIFLTYKDRSAKENLIALMPHKKNAFRWINQALNIADPQRSPAPNVTFSTKYTLNNGKPVTYAHALRQILPNEELLFSYDTDQESNYSHSSHRKNGKVSILARPGLPATSKQ